MKARAGARVLARGVARARRRIQAGGYNPHPGWRNCINPEYRVLTSQTEALRYIGRLVDDEDWRTDKRRSWSAILRRLVHHMDWDNGLVTGLTAERLGTAGDRAPRTVSRVLAWARECGLIVVVEPGASAEFLKTDVNRTPTYALVARVPPLQLDTSTADDVPAGHEADESSVDRSGDLPNLSLSTQPLKNKRRAELTDPPPWPSYAVPGCPQSRNAATLTLITRLGLGGREGAKIEIWRARALLRPWWDAGANIAALLYALEFHPDRPSRSRGDVATGAIDPLRVIGGRLRPWTGRLGEIRATAVGQMMKMDKMPISPAAVPPPFEPRARIAGRGARQAAREALSTHLESLRERRNSPEGRDL